jgi:hypothetical protein
MRRRRGGTFTVVVLLSSALLLAIGGAFSGASRGLSELAGQRERGEIAKQALAGAAEWSTTRVAGWPADKKNDAAKLRFSRATVDVKIETAHEAFMVEATATAAAGTTQSARWLLGKKGDAWVVTRYELK